MRFAIIDADGVARRTGQCPEEHLVYQLFGEGERLVLSDGPPPSVDGRSVWNEEARGFERRPMTTPELDRFRAGCLAYVDEAAEAARLSILTPGAGQAIEYRLTEEEARRLLSADAPSFDAATYPMLAAELEARGSGALTPAVLAAEILAQVRATAQGLAGIKVLRRAAKVAIAEATTEAEIASACTIAWPSPNRG